MAKTKTLERTIIEEVTIEEGQKIKVWDYEERKWYDGNIVKFLNNGKVQVKTDDGLNWDEEANELINKQSYKL